MTTRYERWYLKYGWVYALIPLGIALLIVFIWG
jgi:hypothetical protein